MSSKFQFTMKITAHAEDVAISVFAFLFSIFDQHLFSSFVPFVLLLSFFLFFFFFFFFGSVFFSFFSASFSQNEGLSEIT